MPVYYYRKEDGKVKYLYAYGRCAGCGCLIRPGRMFCCEKCKAGKGHNHTFHFKVKAEPDGAKLKVKGDLEAFM